MRKTCVQPGVNSVQRLWSSRVFTHSPVYIFDLVAGYTNVIHPTVRVLNNRVHRTKRGLAVVFSRLYTVSTGPTATTNLISRGMI